ncbi:MAG: phosphate ABC transporter substrate-binding protein PstS [Solirubrobacteraceae bacterium]
MVAANGRRLLVAACVVLLGLVTACGSSRSTDALQAAVSDPSRAGTISETGSTLLFPLMRTWAAGYHQQFPGVTISTAATGSGAGIAGASAGTVEIGTSDAYLSSGDLVKNPTLLNIPLVISAQQVDYNVPGLSAGTHLKLDGAVLARMYEGAIRRWSDPAIARLNPGVRLPAVAVAPLRRSDSSGDTFLFTSYLSTQDPAWNNAIGYGTTVAWPLAGGALAQKGNSGMVSGCESTPGCVAYIGISYLSQALAGGLGEAQLANAAGQFVLPTPVTIGAAVDSFVSSTPPNETISMVDGPAAGGYPIVNYEYAIVGTRQSDPARARAIRAFLNWAITTGNSAGYLDPVRFQPLPAALVALADEQIGQIR